CQVHCYTYWNPMKFKTSLKRHPWRRKKSSLCAINQYTYDINSKGQLGGFDTPSTLPLQVDPTVYNELVAPKDPKIGQDTPDRGQILIRTRPVVVICPTTEDEVDDDNDEFGEVQKVPIQLYYDSYGDVIENGVWARLRTHRIIQRHISLRHGREVTLRRYSNGTEKNISDELLTKRRYSCSYERNVGNVCDLGELDKRYCIAGEYVRLSQREKDDFQDALEYYWMEKDATEGHELGQEAEEGGMNLMRDNHGRTMMGVADIGGPLSAAGDSCGWSLRDVEGRRRGMGSAEPPVPTHFPHTTLHYGSSSFIDPQDMIWASMCAMYPCVEWKDVGVMGGAGEEDSLWISQSISRQCNSNGESGCLPSRSTPVPSEDITSKTRRFRRRRNFRKSSKEGNGAVDMKCCDKYPLNDNTREGKRGNKRSSIYGSSREDRSSCSSVFTSLQQTPVAAGTTLPGHSQTRALTRIEYDNLITDRNQYVLEEGTRGRNRNINYSPINSDADVSADCSADFLRSSVSPGGVLPLSTVGDVSEERRGKGAWSEAVTRGQASGTYRAVGHLGNSSAAVSARALPREYVSSGSTATSFDNFVGIRGRSVNSERNRVTNVNKKSVNSIEQSGVESEIWHPSQEGVCEGECTCAMPCKVSGIPVYQGRGGELPRNNNGNANNGSNNSVDEASTSSPSVSGTSASVRGRGGGGGGGGGSSTGGGAVGRRNGAHFKPPGGPPNNIRTSTLVGRRGSFGTPGASSRAQTVTRDHEVDLQRRASLPGPGGGAQEENVRARTSVSGSSYRSRTSPSPSGRSHARGASPALGTRAASPAPLRKIPTPTPTRRKDAPTPPSTPRARRPPPKAVYQVRLSPSRVSSIDSPPSHRDKDKPSSRLPVVANKSGKNDTTPSLSRAFPPRPAMARGLGSQRVSREVNKSTINDVRNTNHTGHSSLKLDTPPKSLPLSLSLSSQGSCNNDNTSADETSLNSSFVSNTTDSETSFEKTDLSYTKTLVGARDSHTLTKNKATLIDNKISGCFARPDSSSTRLTSSGSRLSLARRNAYDTPRGSDSKLDRTLSVSSSHITPKTPLARTLSGPKASLVSSDSANRARIVRRVMSGSRTNLSKKKSNSKTSLVVGRHNIYNRSKSGSKNSLLGSRNNLFRASLESQKTESTTDSGCNSPMYGSQCSLDGDRKRHSSASPCSNLRKQLGSNSFIKPKLAESVCKPKIRESRNKEKIARDFTPTRLPVKTTHDIAPIASPEPEYKTAVTKPEFIDEDMSTDTGMDTSVEEKKACETEPITSEHRVKIVHTHSISSSKLCENMEKPIVSIKRSCSLQLPDKKKFNGNKSLLHDMRTKSLSQTTCDEYVDEEGKENRPQPGISVSFLSVSSPVSRSSPNFNKNINKNLSAEDYTGIIDKKEISKVAIIPEIKTKEEKGIQVEVSSSEEEEEEIVEEIEKEEKTEEEEEDEHEKLRYPVIEKTEDKPCEPAIGNTVCQGELGTSATKSQVRGYDGPGNISRPLPGPLMEFARQSTCERVRKNTIVHISGKTVDNNYEMDEKTEIPSDQEQKNALEQSGKENNHLIQRLETSLADIIDSATLKNLKINGNILSDQFDAIIATLKKVAASVDSGETEPSCFSRRNSDCGAKGLLKAPISPSMVSLSPATPLTPTSVSSSSSSSMSPMSPSTPKTPPSKTPLSLFSISECYPGHAGTPPLLPKNRKLSLPRDTLQDTSPTLGELARRLHANPNHLKADQDYVDFIDLDQPYVSPIPSGVSTSDLIRGGPTPKPTGGKIVQVL
ncbi:hypothetical protein SK128_012036, partial [Halocaridina rubra]